MVIVALMECFALDRFPPPQVLVSAFERLSQPDLYRQEQAQKGGKKADGKQLKISRSNENCTRTTVRCPRCREVWGTPLSGLPNYAYNFLMQAWQFPAKPQQRDD